MKVETLQLSIKRKMDRPIVQKLNVVAPFMYRNAHDAMRLILNKGLDEIIAENGIDTSEARSAVG